MVLVNVVPLRRGVLKEKLSYFSAEDLRPGAIVTVPLRGKQVEALITEVEAVDQRKADLKSARFSLKKVSRLKCRSFFLPDLVAVTRQAADYFVAELGQILDLIVPRTLLRHSEEFTFFTPPATVPSFGKDKLLLQDIEAERFAFYKSLIREALSRNQSVFLCVPTVVDLHRSAALLTRGIAEYTLVFDPTLRAKELVGLWKRALTETHPLLIIGTPLFLSLPRPDISTLIVEKENSAGYRTLARPFIDFRSLAEMIANHLSRRLILGDDVLRTETFYRFEQKEFAAATTLKQHMLATASQKIITVGGETVFAPELTAELERILLSNERTLIIAGRRGLSPLTLCQDCGETVVCENCDLPFFLHHLKSEDVAFFVCHHCGSIKTAAAKCRRCGSWRLKEFGLGLEKVVRTLTMSYPQAKIFEVSSDRIKKREQGEELVRQFLGSTGGILAGTEMALSFLKERVENVFIVAIDSLLNLPEFRVSEKVFKLLLAARTLAGKRFFIQTRYPDLPLFYHCLRGRLLDFYRADLAEREKLGYPPFKIFIKVSLAGPKEKTKERINDLRAALSVFEPIVFSAFPRPVNKPQTNLLLRVNPQRWPVPEILRVLRTLPPSFKVEIDPESIFN